MNDMSVKNLRSKLRHIFELASYSPSKAATYSSEAFSTLLGQTRDEKIAFARVNKMQMIQHITDVTERRHLLYFYDINNGITIVDGLVDSIECEQLNIDCIATVLAYVRTPNGKINEVVAELSGLPVSTVKNYVEKIKKQIADIDNTVINKLAEKIEDA